jgi:hypothetical protein
MFAEYLEAIPLPFLIAVPVYYTIITSNTYVERETNAFRPVTPVVCSTYINFKEE